jgi:hypothetical protein
LINPGPVSAGSCWKPDTIDFDVARKLVSAKLIGFWDIETAKAFAVDQQLAVRRVCNGPDQHLVLADLTDFNLQSQAVVVVCQDLITKSHFRSRRLAVVAGDGLARIQIKRILLRDRMQVFSSVDEAMAWLLADDADVGPNAVGAAA